jgi:hypothetical protein
MLTRCVVTVLVLLLLPVVGLADAVPQQSLDVRYDPGTRTIRGRLDVTLPNAEETVYFLLLPNFARERNPYVSPRTLDETYPYGFEPALLDIESVHRIQSPSETAVPFRWLSAPPSLQTYSLEETILAVDLGENHPEETPLRIRFTTILPQTTSGDDGVTGGTLTSRFGWYPILLEDGPEAFEEDGVLHIGERGAFPLAFPWGDMEATFTLPADAQLFTGADRQTVEPSGEEDEWIRHHAVFDSPTRSLAITVGTDYAVYALDGPTPIEVAYAAGREEEARLIATYARDILAHYQARFGAYPRDRLTIVQNPNRDGSAFAADGILWLSSLFFTHRDIPFGGVMNRFLEYVLAHEIAHQWLGLGTGLDLDAEAWLSEGLAQYASISYYEDRHGAFDGNLFNTVLPGVLEELVDRQFGFLNLREHQTELPYLITLWSGFDEELVKPAREVEYANATVARLYDKGYLVARGIASTVGEETFDEALYAAFEEHRAGRLDSRLFQELVEAAAGHSLDEVFDAWVFGDVRADYAVEISSRRRTATGYETNVVVRREGGIAQPVDVEATLSSGATDRQTWGGETPEATLVFHTPSRVTRVTIDPEHRLPDENRLNNNDPVKVVTAVNRAALPLDAYLISPSADSSGFSFSWLDRFRISVQGTSASMVVNEGRHHRFAGSVSIEGNRLTGEIGYAFTDFEQPETGSPAEYWVASTVLSATLRRFLAGEETMWSVGVSAVDLPTFARSSVRAIGLDIAENGAVRLALTAFDEVRLLPSFYLQGVGTVGFSVGELPAAMQFGFDELRAATLPRAPNKLAGRLSVELAGRDEPFNVVNLAMIDRYRTRLFFTAGFGWTSPGQFGKTAPSVEGGIEQVLELSTLGGLLPFAVRIGVAAPLQEPERAIFYVGVSF